MTQEEFIASSQAIAAETQTYSQSISSLLSPYALSRLTTDRQDAYPLIIASDWESLKSFSSEKLSGYASKLSDLGAAQADMNELMNQWNAVKDGFDAYYPRPDAHDSWPEIRKQFESEMIAQGVSEEDANSFLDIYSKKGGLDAYVYQCEQLTGLSKLIHYAFERNLAVYMYHYTSVVLSEYNLALSGKSSPIKKLAKKIDGLQDEINGKMDELYNLIKLGLSADIIAFCSDFESWLDNEFDKEMVPILVNCYDNRKDAHSSFKSDGEHAMEAGDLFRLAQLAKAACKWINWTAQWHPELPFAMDLFEAASTKSNEPLTWEGTELSVGSLHSAGSSYNEKKVIVEGEIKNLTITHVTATKVKSTAEISNSSGSTVKMVLPHIKLDSGGMINGSYAKICGTYYTTNPEADDTAAISLSRMALSDLSESNWNAWLQNGLRDVLQPVSHGLAIAFSLEPGNDGAINPVKYDTLYAKATLINTNPSIY